MSAVDLMAAPALHESARAAGMRAGIRVIDDISAFERIGDAWEELRRSAGGGPFVGHAWLRAWWEAFGQGELRIVTHWRDGQMVAAAPLNVVRHAVSPRIPLPARTGLMLSNHRTGFNEWLIAPSHDDSTGLLLDAVVTETGAFLFEFEPMRRGRGHDLLTAALAERRFPHRTRTIIRSVLVDLSGGWEGYLSRLPRSRRKAFRVAERRVAEQNPALVPADRHSGAELVERALALGRATWKGKAGTALGSSEAGCRFLRRLWQLLGPNSVDLCLLTIDGVDAASALCLREGETGYAFAADFREEHAHLSPGRYVILDWLRRCADEGIVTADLLRNTPFCRTFSEETYDLCRVAFASRHNVPWILHSIEAGLAPIGRSYRTAYRMRTRRRSGHKTTMEGARQGVAAIEREGGE